LTLGERETEVADGWSSVASGVVGEVITLKNRQARTRVELSMVPRVLAGDSEIAVAQGIELASQQHGIAGIPRVRTTSDGATARVDGSDKHGRARVLEVHAMPRGDQLILVVALVQRSDTPLAYRRLLDSVRQM